MYRWRIYSISRWLNRRQNIIARFFQVSFFTEYKQYTILYRSNRTISNKYLQFRIMWIVYNEMFTPYVVIIRAKTTACRRHYSSRILGYFWIWNCYDLVHSLELTWCPDQLRADQSGSGAWTGMLHGRLRSSKWHINIMSDSGKGNVWYLLLMKCLLRMLLL